MATNESLNYLPSLKQQTEKSEFPKLKKKKNSIQEGSGDNLGRKT